MRAHRFLGVLTWWVNECLFVGGYACVCVWGGLNVSLCVMVRWVGGWVGVCMCERLCLRLSMHVLVRVRVRVHVCLRACVHVRVPVSVHVYKPVHVHVGVGVCVRVPVYVCTCCICVIVCFACFFSVPHLWLYVLVRMRQTARICMCECVCVCVCAGVNSVEPELSTAGYVRQARAGCVGECGCFADLYRLANQLQATERRIPLPTAAHHSSSQSCYIIYIYNVYTRAQTMLYASRVLCKDSPLLLNTALTLLQACPEPERGCSAESAR